MQRDHMEHIGSWYYDVPLEELPLRPGITVECGVCHKGKVQRMLLRKESRLYFYNIFFMIMPGIVFIMFIDSGLKKINFGILCILLIYLVPHAMLLLSSYKEKRCKYVCTYC